MLLSPGSFPASLLMAPLNITVNLKNILGLNVHSSFTPKWKNTYKDSLAYKKINSIRKTR